MYWVAGAILILLAAIIAVLLETNALLRRLVQLVDILPSGRLIRELHDKTSR